MIFAIYFLFYSSNLYWTMVFLLIPIACLLYNSFYLFIKKKKDNYLTILTMKQKYSLMNIPNVVEEHRELNNRKRRKM